MHQFENISPTLVWLLVGCGLTCVVSIILGLNLTLGTRRRLGHFFIWIPAAVIVTGITAALLLMAYH